MPTPNQFWLNLPKTGPANESDRIVERCIRDLPTGRTKLATSTLISTTASVTFTSIPQIYNSLELQVVAGTTASPSNNLNVIFNADTGLHYFWQLVTITTGGVPTTSDANSQAALAIGIVDDTGLLSSFSATRIAAYSKLRTRHNTLMHAVGYGNASRFMYVGGGVWTPTTAQAITSMTITPGAGSFIAGSQFNLYGEF